MLFGTFDGIHEGHLNLFKQAKSKGDYLIVIVGRDETVKKVKNRYPKIDEKGRMKDLKKYSVIDKVLLGGKKDPYDLIERIKPDIICLGYDQKSFTKDLSKEIKLRGLKSKIVRLKAYRPDIYHSSKLKK